MSAKGDETTVIVVDDDRATRTLILEILKNEPYRVEVFSSQEAAAEFHRKSGCSAVIYAVSILDESAAAFYVNTETDRLHLNPAGHRRIAGIIAGYMRRFEDII